MVVASVLQLVPEGKKSRGHAGGAGGGGGVWRRVNNGAGGPGSKRSQRRQITLWQLLEGADRDDAEEGR